MKQAVCGILPILGLFISVSRKDDPNKIGFIGGKVDEGETLEEAIVRETLEETGLHVSVIPREPYVDQDNGYIVTCFLLKLIDREHTMTSEHETGIVKLSNRIQLVKSSPYGNYNERAFNWYNITD